MLIVVVNSSYVYGRCRVTSRGLCCMDDGVRRSYLAGASNRIGPDRTCTVLRINKISRIVCGMKKCKQLTRRQILLLRLDTGKIL